MKIHTIEGTSVVIELLKDLAIKIDQAEMYTKKTPSIEDKELYKKTLFETIKLIEDAYPKSS